MTLMLVEIRCKAKGCRHLLASITERPESWVGELRIRPCPRHNGTGPSNPLKFASWAVENYRVGDALPTATVWIKVDWANLKPLVERSERVGRKVTTTV